MIRNEFEFQIAKHKLIGYFYKPVQPKAVIVLVHGMGEYANRYERVVIPLLLKESIAVVSYDQFGHGHSDGKKGHHPGYHYIMDALEKVNHKATNLFPSLPAFLYGHSMGGNVVINYLLRRQPDLQGSIVTSPFLRLAFSPPAWKITLGKFIQQIFPSLTMPNELDVMALSKKTDEIEAYQNDPLIHDRVSPAFSLEFMKTGEWAIANAKSLNTSMLLLHGEKDRITSCSASKEFAEKSNGKVTFYPVENGFHELHHDLENEIILPMICEWIQKTITRT